MAAAPLLELEGICKSFGSAQVLALSKDYAAADRAFVELLEWQLDIGSYGRVAAMLVGLERQGALAFE